MNTTTSGLTLSIDMYGDGFRCYNVMYRLARVMRDFGLENDVRYLAAKQNMVTFALLSPGMAEYNRSVRNTGETVQAGSCVSLLGLDGDGLITHPWFPNDPKKWNAPFQLILTGSPTGYALIRSLSSGGKLIRQTELSRGVRKANL